MRRFWIPRDEREGATLRIAGDVLHHIRDVCRLGVGDRFEALLGDGLAHLVEIRSAGRKEALGEILESRRIPRPKPPHLHLAVSLPKFPVFEAILEKAVELGVRRLTPFLSDRSFVRGDLAAVEAKRTRWEKIVRGAAQQCGRGELMELGAATALDALLRGFPQAEGRAGLFAFEGRGAPLRDAAGTWNRKSLEEVWLFVGSEGGFSDAEAAAFRSGGLQPVSLGPRILRVETACVALVGIVQYELGNLDGDV